MALTTQGIKKKRAAAKKQKCFTATLPSQPNTQHTPSPPKRSRGRPPKHPRNQPPSSSAAAAAPPNRRTRSTYVSPSPIPTTRTIPRRPATVHRTTRSNARPTRSFASKQRDFYVAVPSSPIRAGPTINWHQVKAEMQLRIQMHSDGKDAYKRMWWFSLSSATPEEIIDRPILATVSTGSPNEARMQQLLSSFIKNNPNHPVVISLTTMAQKQSTTKDNLPAELLSRSMKELVNHHLRQLSEQNKADSVADILFNGEIFGKAATTKVARYIARGVNSHDFSAVALLQTIDCHVGALNDTGVSQYANIGNPSRGLSLLPKRHHLSHLRSFCDRYIAELLKVKHEQSTAYGEYIHCDYERQLRFLIEQYGLTDTAASTGVQIAITGDGAAMCTSSRKAGQTCLGIKMIDPSCRRE